MKRFSQENSYIFPQKELEPPIFLRKKILYKLLYFLEDLVDSLYMAFTYAPYRAPRKARANNEKLKSARNEHNLKNKSFYAYENVMRM